MFNYDVKFLTCDESLQLKNGDFKSYKYETKKKVEESIYDIGKRNYCERRGGYWRAPKPRQIRQLESKLRDRHIVACLWTNHSLITIVFSSGAISYLIIKPDTLDIVQILFDRYFVGKLSGQVVTGVAICKAHLLFTHTDRAATLITFGKITNNTSPCRISDRDPHIQTIELSGGSRRAERQISCSENNLGSRVLIWGAAAAEPAPWSPILEDHANFHLYQITGQHMNLVVCHHLENETLSADLSSNCDSVIHIVEQVVCHKSGVSLNWLRYDVSDGEYGGRLANARCSTTRIRLPAPARAVRRSPCDMRLLTACIDGTLHLAHQNAGVTHTARAGFIPTDVRWAGELAVAAEEGGRLQCFDRALSLLHHHTKCIDLGSYLREPRCMQLLAAHNSRGGPKILATFAGGPLTLLCISHPDLLMAWLRCGRASNAVSLLRALDWEREGARCLAALTRLVCDPLRRGLRPDTETAIEAALGAYLAPSAPHSAAAQRFAPAVHDLARKFFHHLLRRGRVEKALSLAVDVSAWDLFADARWAARRCAMPALADEAASLAATYAQRTESECSESCSQCSSHSYGSEDEESHPEPIKTKPPPLPRVSLASQTLLVPGPMPTVSKHSTLMSVPITQNEPASTNSIRPNLHQYLERDNTIWNTDVRDDMYTRKDAYRPILNSNIKWHSVDNMLLNYKQNLKHNSLISINEAHTVIDVIPRPHDDNTTTAHFKHLFQAELREEAPSTLYRYQNNYYPSTTGNDRTFKKENSTERTGSRPHGEKNKVKFSDTVTIAVVSESAGCLQPERELADSLPLCAPHKYLAAFAPQLPAPAAPSLPSLPSAHPARAPPAGTTLDYVEV